MADPSREGTTWTTSTLCAKEAVKVR